MEPFSIVSPKSWILSAILCFANCPYAWHILMLVIFVKSVLCSAKPLLLHYYYQLSPMLIDCDFGPSICHYINITPLISACFSLLVIIIYSLGGHLSPCFLVGHGRQIWAPPHTHTKATSCNNNAWKKNDARTYKWKFGWRREPISQEGNFIPAHTYTSEPPSVIFHAIVRALSERWVTQRLLHQPCTPARKWSTPQDCVKESCWL